MTEQPTTCPACGAANRPARELCARCGAGLDDGVLPPAPVQRDAAPDPPTVHRAPRAHARWLLPLLGGLVAVAALVVALTLVGLGPFASGPDVPTATFTSARYDDEAALLTLSDVATRTTSEDADAEAAAAIADGDPTTAWRSAGGSSDEDVLETIDLVLAEPAWIERIELHNGDHADREAYDASSPLREARLTFDGGVVLRAELLDLGLRAQVVTLPEPVLTTVLRVDVLERVAGPHDQLAVSELALLGWRADGPDVDLARERAEVEPATGPTSAPGVGLGRGQSS